MTAVLLTWQSRCMKCFSLDDNNNRKWLLQTSRDGMRIRLLWLSRLWIPVQDFMSDLHVTDQNFKAYTFLIWRMWMLSFLLREFSSFSSHSIKWGSKMSSRRKPWDKLEKNRSNPSASFQSMLFHFTLSKQLLPVDSSYSTILLNLFFRFTEKQEKNTDRMEWKRKLKN